jgi:hypothetical protein
VTHGANNSRFAYRLAARTFVANLHRRKGLASPKHTQAFELAWSTGLLGRHIVNNLRVQDQPLRGGSGIGEGREQGEVTMSEESIRTAGILLVTVPAVAFGGATLLRLIWRREPGYLDNPVRQNLWRAGHAHAGVLVILALVGMFYVDRTGYSGGMSILVRVLIVQAPILMPLGFFLSVASPRSERPNGLIYLVPTGGLLLSIGALILGIGLLTA